jgi:hypothetical protein
LRERDTNFSQGLESCLQYSLKDYRKKLAEEEERTTLEGSWTKRTQKKKPAHFLKEPSKIDAEELQNGSSLKELEYFAQIR